MKGTILHIKNTDDSLWFTFKANITTMELLDQVFDIVFHLRHSYSNSGVEEKVITYKGWLEGLTEWQMDEGFVAYFFLQTEQVHLILRKTGAWEAKRDSIMERFKCAKK